MKRRSFLKLSAAAAAASGAPSALFAANAPAAGASVQNGSVLTGAHWGILKLDIKDGKVVKSSPWKNASKLRNDLQEFTPDLLYKNRIKQPYVRKSFLADPLNNKPELRGKDEWVAVSWEQALKLASEALYRTRESKGASGVFAGSYGWKSSGNVHNSRTLLHRFMNLTGGFVGSLGDYSTGASQVIMPHVVGSIEVYEQQTNWELVLENAKTVVIWGANPIDTLKIAWTVSDNEGLKYFEKLKASKIKIIAIDPYASSTVKFFGERAEHIKVRPNTDVAMMLAMMHHLVSNDLHAKDFLADYTSGYDKFEAYLLGKSDGQPKTPEWAEKITGVSAAQIKELAELLRKDRSLLLSGWGMQRAHHGEQPHWALVTLACMLGHIGTDGGGFGLSYHYSNGGVATTNAPVVGGVNANSVGKWQAGKFLGVVGAEFDSNGHLIAGAEADNGGNTGQSWLAKTTDNAIPVARIADMLLHPGKKIQHNGKEITYADIDFIYWVGGNPFVHHQDLKTLRKAWQKPSCVVVNEIYWTPTARHADILLPATSEYERDDISMGGDYSNKYIVPMKAAVPPVGEAKDDYEIFSELIKVYGQYAAIKAGASADEAAKQAVQLYNAFRENKTPLEQVQKYYELAKNGAKVDIPEFADFWAANKPLEFEPAEGAEEFVRFKDFVEDPILNPLGTPSGLIEIYSDAIAAMKYADCPAHPSWLEPIEWLGAANKPARFHMISPHPTSRLHSQLCHTSLREEYAVAGHEPLRMSAQDAKELGLANGDLIEVYNERGKAICGLVIDDVLPGVVVLQEGGWYDPDEQGNCRYGCANVLTIDIPTSPLANGNISHTALVNVRKLQGAAPAIAAFTPPAGL